MEDAAHRCFLDGYDVSPLQYIIFTAARGRVILSSFLLLPFPQLLLPPLRSISIATKLASFAAMGKKVGAQKIKRGSKEKAIDVDNLRLKKVDYD